MGKAPGRALLKTLQKRLGGLRLIAEDLGVITPDVERLRDDFNLPGMRVLQFAFDGTGENLFLPHRYVQNCIAYTGTHDNDTTAGWWRSLKSGEKKNVRNYLGDVTDRTIAWEMIRAAWHSIANVAIAPVQDLLNLGSKARMNMPGVAEGNWSWRLRERELTNELADRLREITTASGRQKV